LGRSIYSLRFIHFNDEFVVIVTTVVLLMLVFLAHLVCLESEFRNKKPCDRYLAWQKTVHSPCPEFNARRQNRKQCLPEGSTALRQHFFFYYSSLFSCQFFLSNLS